MRRYLMGGLGGAFLLAVGVHLAAGAAACNEPAATAYGNPNTLDRKNLPGEGGAEPLICGGGEGGAGEGFDGGCPSFATDIFPYFQANGRWRCADATCHGGASAPPIATTDPTSCLSSLKTISVGGVAYVAEGSTDPNASTVLCNLQGTCGSRMPKAPGEDPTNAELCMLEAWLKCGSPP
ncbi:MAG: hypothetical protein KF795_16585 [Labilithrix sp.]|nr:hypothetical protein [Labilithrix sp.]